MNILPTVSFATYEPQTARLTKMLANIPLIKACANVRFTFVTATLTA